MLLELLMWPLTSAFVWFGALLGVEGNEKPPPPPLAAAAAATATAATALQPPPLVAASAGAADADADADAIIASLRNLDDDELGRVWDALEALHLNPHLRDLARTTFLYDKVYTYAIGLFITLGLGGVARLPQHDRDQFGDTYPVAFLLCALLLVGFRNDFAVRLVPLLLCVFFGGALVSKLAAVSST